MIGLLGTLYLLASFALSFSIINLLFQLSPTHAYIILASYLVIIGLETYFKHLARRKKENESTNE